MFCPVCTSCFCRTKLDTFKSTDNSWLQNSKLCSCCRVHLYFVRAIIILFSNLTTICLKMFCLTFNWRLNFKSHVWSVWNLDKIVTLLITVTPVCPWIWFWMVGQSGSIQTKRNYMIHCCGPLHVHTDYSEEASSAPTWVKAKVGSVCRFIIGWFLQTEEEFVFFHQEEEEISKNNVQFVVWCSLVAVVMQAAH